jgi:hypothetical protein
MRLGGIGCCAALLLCVALATATDAVCLGPGCGDGAGARPLAKPLDLTRFMRHSKATQAARPAKKRKVVRQPVAKRRTPPAAAPSPKPAKLPTGAEAAYALLPDPPVRVVSSAEFNEIDLAAGPAPLAFSATATTTGMAVRVVDAAEFNDIDRKAEITQPATAEPTAPDRDDRTRTGHGSDTWIGRVWTAALDAFGALAAGLRWLFG